MAIAWDWVIQRSMFYFTPFAFPVFIKVLFYPLTKRTWTWDPTINIDHILCLAISHIVAWTAGRVVVIGCTLLLHRQPLMLRKKLPISDWSTKDGLACPYLWFLMMSVLVYSFFWYEWNPLSTLLCIWFLLGLCVFWLKGWWWVLDCCAFLALILICG